MKILVIHGAGMNMRGKVQTEIFGTLTLPELNSINPGPIESDGAHAQGLIDHFRELGRQTALGRIGQPDDVAPAVVYLASDDAPWVTVETHDITGGVR